MLFSVIITTYNRCYYLKKSIQSVLNQSRSVEIIVIDDASQDDTEKYCKSVQDKIIYYRNKKNSGQAASINCGIQLAKSPWIKFLDDDDMLREDCIEKLELAVQKCAEVVILSTEIAISNKRGKVISQSARRGQGDMFYVPQEDIHYGMLFDGLPFGCTSQVAVRKDIFSKVGGWNEKLDTSHFNETNFWIEAAKWGNALIINEPLICHQYKVDSYNDKFPIYKKFEKNIKIKKKLYHLIDKDRKLPAFKLIENYIKLYWGAVSIKHRRFLECLQIAIPALFDFKAWKHLLKVIIGRKSKYRNFSIKRFIFKK